MNLAGTTTREFTIRPISITPIATVSTSLSMRHPSTHEAEITDAFGTGRTLNITETPGGC